MPAPMSSPAPKKETARITVLPDPLVKSAVQMKKTQPLTGLPPIEKPAASVTVTPQPRVRADEMPMLLCWALFGASVVILILQIWNYVS